MRYGPLLGSLGLAATMLLIGPGLVRTTAGLGLVLMLGHGVATRLVALQPRDALGRLVVSWTLGLPLAGMVFLGLYHLRLAGSSRLCLAVLTILASSAALLPERLRLDLPWPRPLTGRHLAAALAALILAAAFRMPHLGYADFQGDEVRNALDPAVKMLQGAEGVLESRRRPPLQAVVPAAMGHLAGQVTERTVRLPVALSSLAAVYLAGVLGAGLFGPTAGVLAMFLLALDGLQVALGRIVQCQAFITMLLLLAACALWQARGDPHRRPAWTWVGFLAWGLAAVAHYEALLLAPLALATLVRAARSPDTPTSSRRAWTMACVATVVLPVAVAYLPLATSPALPGHVSYYSSMRFRDVPNFNLPAMLETGWTYLSGTHLLLLVVGLGGLWSAPDAPRPATLRFLAGWAGPNLLFFLVLMGDPGTHVYTIFLPWTVAAAGGLDRLGALAGREVTVLRRSVAMPSLATGVACVVLLLAGSAWHAYTAFLRHDPEYPWPLAKAARPNVRLYGFPYRRGWRTAGWLVQTGVLRGPYVTNEKSDISGYYLRQPPADLAGARYALLVHDPQSGSRDRPLPGGCIVTLRIVSGGRPAIDVCERGGAATPVRTLEAAKYDRAFTALGPAPG